jgi:hypothetical protein
MIRQTNLAQTIDVAAARARYDECAKKLLSYQVIAAWILRSCVKEFSQNSVQYIMDNCLKEKPEISTRAVHQDHPDRQKLLDGDRMVDQENSEATGIKEQTVYFDIRFQASVPGATEPILLIINLEIQLDDAPGYPLVTRGFYYCARMVSEQYGTVFTGEHYEKLRKVYSIWICPDPAKKRRNGIFRYHTVEEEVCGTSSVDRENFDLMEVIVLNLGEADRSSSVEILDLLSVLFSTETSPEEKKKILSRDFHIAMTEELESGVKDMCNLSRALIDQGVQQGLEQGEDLFAQLMQKLFAMDRAEDAKKAAEDKEYRHKLMEELQIARP